MNRSGHRSAKTSSQESVEAVSSVFLGSAFASGMCEQIGVIDVLKISCQDNVEAVKIVLQV